MALTSSKFPFIFRKTCQIKLISLFDLEFKVFVLFCFLFFFYLRQIIIWLVMQITATLTFASACASAGITVLISNDLNLCSENHCTSFETAAAMAFIGWFAVSPSFLLNLWSLACRWKMRRNGYSLLSIWVWPRSSFSFLVVDGWFPVAVICIL